MLATSLSPTSIDPSTIFAIGLLGVVIAVGLAALQLHWPLLRWLYVEGIVVAAAILYLSVVVFRPLLLDRAPVEEQAKISLPAYDYGPWRAWPVQVDGRTKPFETAAREAMRKITGREKFEDQDAVVVVLQWMLCADGEDNDPRFVDWEHKPFLLCDHQNLRQAIFGHLAKDGAALTPEQLHGKYVAPADLRDSPGLKDLLKSAAVKHEQDKDKASQHMTPEENKAEEVAGRLVEFDSISQRDAGPNNEERHHEDPIHVAVLDRVASGAWFSLGELREMKQNPDRADGMWRSVMYKRLKVAPQLYILKGEYQEVLQRFQEQLKAGQGQQAIDELSDIMHQRAERKVREFEQAAEAGDANRAMQLFGEIAKTQEERSRVLSLLHGDAKSQRRDALSKELRAILDEHEQALLKQLKSRTAAAMRYGPDKPEYTMLYLDYMEARFPDLYRELAFSQTFPSADATRLLDSRSRLLNAYRSGDTDKFSEASQDFFATVEQVSQSYVPYPGQDTIADRLLGLLRGRLTTNPSPELLNLELQYNHVQPFLWAWIVMLGGAAFLIASMVLKSRVAYWLGLATYVGAMGLEGYGFYARMVLAGRPPVSNMYETLVWVAFMSAVFALVLEMVYRRKVIGLAGALVSTLALVLAAQLPVDLGVKISPIVPVLRSNYWLTIHVLTIVSSYAAGTLAWGLANIALGLLAFGSPSRELLRTLSQYTYRAIQIAVLLLAAGTFLGGWWAAESWGRFWGWDPKEVWALIALVCYVIPLHARYIGWVKDFGLAVSAVLCYAAIVMSWYGVNFVLAAGLHSYGFGSGPPWGVFWAGLLNIEWVIMAAILYHRKLQAPDQEPPAPVEDFQAV